MKKIVLRFYSCHNLGDDLFVLLFTEHFSSCRIRLLVNPKCIPGELPPNVRIHPYSYLDFLLCKLIDLCDVHGITGALRLLNRFQTGCIDILKSNCDAFVKIGGSIFMRLDARKSIFLQRKKWTIPSGMLPTVSGIRLLLGQILGLFIQLTIGHRWKQSSGSIGTSVCETTHLTAE